MDINKRAAVADRASFINVIQNLESSVLPSIIMQENSFNFSYYLVTKSRIYCVVKLGVGSLLKKIL